MNEQELATLVNLVMESILADGAMLDNLHDAQIVIRPISRPVASRPSGSW